VTDFFSDSVVVCWATGAATFANAPLPPPEPPAEITDALTSPPPLTAAPPPPTMLPVTLPPPLTLATPPARAVAPGKGPTASPHANGQPRVVTVQRGDTASKLARDLGTTVTAIAEANPGLDVSKLKPGAKVNVPR
jgi:nucleoid-associated protein YgaU